jgi:hypothetical protein
MAAPVGPTISRPKAEVITAPLSTIVQPKQQLGAKEDIDALRTSMSAALSALQQAARGSQHEQHAAEAVRKLEPLSTLSAQLPAPTLASLLKFCKAVEARDWATAEATFEALTKDNTKELSANSLTGLRFLLRLSKQLV